MVRTLLIMGPTASGKSALALALARRLDGVVINADSMQVYRDLRVLTARPNPQEEAQAPHSLYGFVDAAERYSVAKWAQSAQGEIEGALAAGRTPIVVGGTGLYFRALTHGLSVIPTPDARVFARLKGQVASGETAALHGRLAAVDPPTAASVSPRDGVRIVRALAVFESSGQPLSAWRGAARPVLAEQAWRGVALWPDRAALYGRIDARFEAMLAAGALEEARVLAARGLDPSLPAMRAHGAPWLMRAAVGGLRVEEAAALSARDTRHYAKRQFTWINGQMGDWPRFSGFGETAALELILDLFGSGGQSCAKGA